VIEPENEPQAGPKLSERLQTFLHRLYRDPRYLLVGRMERFGRELIAFIEGCTILSGTGDVRGQALLNSEFEMRGRPDGERPYGFDSLVEYYLSGEGRGKTLEEEELNALREESWEYYIRRNFAFLMSEWSLARDDAEHNLAIWSLFEQAEVREETKWPFLRWWPWIERDRAVAEALLGLEHDNLEHAAAELYRSQRAIRQYLARHDARYEQEGEEGREMCNQMASNLATLTEILREENGLPVSMEERLEEAQARGDQEEVERLRAEMIRRAMAE
jgi:hypothetical protein